MPRRRRARFTAVWLALLLGCAAPAAAQTLRVGTFEDLDVADPVTSRNFAGLQMLSAFCDKLLDLTPDLRVVGQLAETFEWVDGGRGLLLHLRRDVQFQDGTPFDAEAVRFNIERAMRLPTSSRRGEMPVVQGVTVLAPATARIDLSEPFVPLLSVLVTRGGMMVSPKAVIPGGTALQPMPACSGPFRLMERVPLDKVVGQRNPGYWNAGAIKLERVEFRPMPDSNIRLQNLRAGALDLIERVAPTDLPTVRAQDLRLATATELGYQFIRFNLHNGAGARGPFAADPRLREAFELALDRSVLNQVVFAGEFLPGNQWVSPQHPFYDATHPVPGRDLARARALLAEAGQPSPTLRLTVQNAAEALQAAEVIQAMEAEAGITVQIVPLEIGAASQASLRGEYEAFMNFWGGRSDPDGNASPHLSCAGPNNDARYCVPAVDAGLARARTTSDPEARRAAYAAVASQVLTDRPYVYLWHRRNYWAYTDRLTGFTAYPDSVFRWAGMGLR